MRKLALALLFFAMVAPASATNVLVNGDFGTGDETGWTRWRAPWGATENWFVNAGDGLPPPSGQLFGGGGNSSYGWYQVIPVPYSEYVRVDAMWKGDIGGSGWAEIMLYSSANANEDWGNRADVGAAADIAYKKDSWGMNPPTAWDWQPASLSPHPSGNGGVIHSLGYVCVAVKLGGFPLGYLSVDNITLNPLPVHLSLIGLSFEVFPSRSHSEG